MSPVLKINNLQDSVYYDRQLLLHTTKIFLYPLKKFKKLWYSDVLGGIERRQWHEIG